MSKSQITEYQKKKMLIDEANLVVSTVAMAAAVAALSLNEKDPQESSGESRMAKRINPGDYANKKDYKRASRQEIKRASVEDFGYTGHVIVLNEGGRSYPRIVPVPGETERSLRKKFRTGINDMAYSEVGYSGPVFVLNKPANKKRAPAPKKAPARSSPGRRWVAMEMNRRTGGDIQAIVCESRAQAEDRAESMRLAHKKGSARSRDCIQGYALMDPSRGIDVPAWFEGRRGVVYRV